MKNALLGLTLMGACTDLKEDDSGKVEIDVNAQNGFSMLNNHPEPLQLHADGRVRILNCLLPWVTNRGDNPVNGLPVETSLNGTLVDERDVDMEAYGSDQDGSQWCVNTVLDAEDLAPELGVLVDPADILPETDEDNNLAVLNLNVRNDIGCVLRAMAAQDLYEGHLSADAGSVELCADGFSPFPEDVISQAAYGSSYSDPYCQAIAAMNTAGWMTGRTEELFAPRDCMNQAEAAQALLNTGLVSAPLDTTAEPCLDLPEGEWYTPAMQSVVQSSIEAGQPVFVDESGNCNPADDLLIDTWADAFELTGLEGTTLSSWR